MCLFTEIAVCKFLRGLAFSIVSEILQVVVSLTGHFSASFCTAHCALDLARDHAP